MKVLMITGDKRFGPGHPRYDLQRSAVDGLAVVYFGRGSVWPTLPPGPYDVVTAQDPFWRGLFGWYAAKRVRAKFNVQVHTDLESVSGVRHVLMQLVLRHAGSVRVMSEKIKAQVGKFAPKTKVSVLPVYVNIEHYKNIVYEPRDKKVVLWVGRFEPEKDPLAAIEIFKQVQKGIEAKLIMLGAGSLEARLRTAAKNLPVDFPGWQSPVPYLAQADVVLSTSKQESWGQSIVEALAAGVPVVAPDVGVAREAGAIVVPREQLADAVLECLKSGARGHLQLGLLPAAEWAKQWKDTLL